MSGVTSSIRDGDQVGLRSLSITAARTPSRKSSLRKTSSAARYSRTRHSSRLDAVRASRSSLSVTTMPRGDFSLSVFNVASANSEPSRMSRESDAAAHHNAVHEGDIRFREFLDPGVEDVLFPPQDLAEVTIDLRTFPERTDVAAGTQATLAGTFQHDHGNGGIGLKTVE